MSWLGWLTKGRCEVSVLDIFTAIAEITLMILIVGALWIGIFGAKRR